MLRLNGLLRLQTPTFTVTQGDADKENQGKDASFKHPQQLTDQQPPTHNKSFKSTNVCDVFKTGKRKLLS